MSSVLVCPVSLLCQVGRLVFCKSVFESLIKQPGEISGQRHVGYDWSVVIEAFDLLWRGDEDSGFREGRAKYALSPFR